MCRMQKGNPSQWISYFNLHTCGMRNPRPHPESTESFSNTWDLKSAKERRSLDVWHEEGVKDEAREREGDFATGARWRGRGEGEDGEWATERAPRVVIVVPGDTECGWGNYVTTTAKSPNAVRVGYPFSKQGENSANPPKPSFTRTTNLEDAKSLQFWLLAPQIPHSANRRTHRDIAGLMCAVGEIDNRTETHAWSKLTSPTSKWRSLQSRRQRTPPLLRDEEADERGTSHPLLFVAALSWDNFRNASITQNSIRYSWWLSPLTRIVGRPRCATAMVRALPHFYLKACLRISFARRGHLIGCPHLLVEFLDAGKSPASVGRVVDVM